MIRFKITIGSLVCLMWAALATEAFSGTVEYAELNCVGTFSFLDNGAGIMEDKIKRDELETFIIGREDGKVFILYSGIHQINTENGDKITENDSGIIGIAADSHAAKVLIKFEKKDKSLLMVSNGQNGLVNKYEATCY